MALLTGNNGKVFKPCTPGKCVTLCALFFSETPNTCSLIFRGKYNLLVKSWNHGVQNEVLQSLASNE